MIPARLRYVSGRIKQVAEIAASFNLSFYILSGKFGLISADTAIPYYDQKLCHEKVDSLVERVMMQIRESGIKKIVFYVKDKSASDWETYCTCLKTAAERVGCKLEIKQFNSVNKIQRS